VLYNENDEIITVPPRAVVPAHSTGQEGGRGDGFKHRAQGFFLSWFLSTGTVPGSVSYDAPSNAGTI
jgi:hypothetical protein